MSCLNEVLNKKVLRSLAGSTYYGRGEDYFQSRSVGKLEIGEDYVAAKVFGTHRYSVKISVLHGKLHGKCNCPLGRDHEFCKHLVALGLAYIAHDEVPMKEHKKVFDWKKFVSGCSVKELREIVFAMSPHCPKIVEEYRMKNLPLETTSLACELKSKIDELIAVAEDIGDDDERYYDYYDDEYEDDDGFIEGLKQLRAAFEAVAKQHNFTLLFELSEYAIEKFRESSAQDEEPASDFLDLVLEFYCIAAKGGAGTAEHIVAKINEWEKQSSYGFGCLNALFFQFPEGVRKIWHESACREWKEFPRLGMGSRCENRWRRHVEQRLLRLARDNNDFEFILQVMLNNLSEERDVLALAEEYKRGKQTRLILPLLKKAREAFPNSRQIRDALVAEQQRVGDFDAALKLAWRDLEKTPLSPGEYKLLMTVAKRAKRAPEYMEKILTLLAAMEGKKSHGFYSFHGDPARNRQIEILLEARQEKRAWELGRDVVCDERLKIRLAQWRGGEHPGDAAEVYAGLLESAVKPTGDEAYEHVVKLLKEFKRFLISSGQESRYSLYVQWLRSEYKRRKNLIALLNRHKLN